MKTCARCKEQKPFDQFNKKTKTRLQSFCKPCNREYQREHYLNNKEVYAAKRDRWRKNFKNEVYTFLKDAAKNGCVKCGEKDYACLQFHHINAEDKVDSISRLLSDSRSLVTIKEDYYKNALQTILNDYEEQEDYKTCSKITKLINKI